MNKIYRVPFMAYVTERMGLRYNVQDDLNVYAPDAVVAKWAVIQYVETEKPIAHTKDAVVYVDVDLEQIEETNDTVYDIDAERWAI